MKDSKFKIGQASKLIGIAPETIRYYERKKIIRPLKDTDNGYRQFDIIDVCMIGKARTYLGYGFSLEEAQALLESDDLGQIRTQLEQRAREIEENVRQELARLGALQKKLEDINSVSDNFGRFSIRTRPALLCDQQFENAAPCPQEENLPRESILLENQLVTFPYLEFRPKELMDGEPDNYTVAVGIAIWESDAPAAGLTDYSCLQFHPAVPCIYTSLEMRLNEDHRQALAPVTAFLRRSGIPAAGNVFCRTISVRRTDDDIIYYRDVWIPIVQERESSR